MSTRILKFFFIHTVLISSLIMSACSEGDRGFVAIPDEEIEEEPLALVINVGGVKGPLVNAEVGLYKLDLNSGLIKQHGDASEAFFRLLAQENVVVDSVDTVSVNPGTTETAALNGIQDHVKSLGYVTELPRLQSEIKASDSISQARLNIDSYLGGTETNSLPKKEVQKIYDTFATLSELKVKIAALDPFITQLSELSTVSSAMSLINKFRAAESDNFKLLGWLAIRSTFQNTVTSISLLRKNFNDRYSALTENNTIQEDTVALNRLEQLEQDLLASGSIELAETHITQAIAEEGNVIVRESLSALKTSIVSLDDFISQAHMDNALYHFSDLKTKITDIAVTNLDAMYTSVMETLRSEFEPSLADAFKNETLDIFGDPKNQIFKNVSGSNSLLEGINLEEYSGYVYMEVVSLNNTVDLNSGTKPIISTMNTIFHTDIIRGYGDNDKENRILYYLKDGQEQRDSEGELITDLSEIDNDNNEILEVQPYRYATPLTKLAVSMVTERYKNFSPQFMDANGDGEIEYRLTESGLKTELASASNTIIETFGLDGLNDDSITQLPAIYESAAILTLPMQYSDEEQSMAVQYRAMVEGFSAFINSLIQETNLDTEVLFSAVVADMLDEEIDGRTFDEEIESLTAASDVAFLVKRSPSDIFIPGVNKTIDDIASLMSSQLQTVEPSFPLASLSLQDLVFSAPKGGVDTDADGYLNNSDRFPEDETKHIALDENYSGVWALKVANVANQIAPFSGELTYRITRNTQTIETSLTVCSSDEESCLFEGVDESDFAASWDVIRGPNGGNLQITSTFVDENQIGFNAIGSVSGVYQVRLQLVTEVEPIQRYSKTIAIEIMDPQLIEIRFFPEAPKAGELVAVQFEASDSICRAYSFCDDSNIGDYFDISELPELQASWNLNGSEPKQYRRFDENPDDATDTTVYFNSADGDNLNIDVIYSSGSTELGFVEFIAAEHSAIVGLKTDTDDDGITDDLDAFKTKSGCYRQYDGFVNDLGEEVCTSTYINEETTPNTHLVDISFGGENWLYDATWNQIFRLVPEDDGVIDSDTRYLESIELVADDGTEKVVASILVDDESRRAYIVYSDGEIDYFDFDDQQLHDFVDPYNDLAVVSILPVGLTILVEYGDGVEPSEFQLYQPNGELSIIQAKAKYPKPGLPVELEVDGNAIQEFAQNLKVSWTLKRLVADVSTDIQIATSDDNLIVLAGQTAYGDVLTVSFSNSDDVTIKSIQIAVLDTLGFSLEKTTYRLTESLSILAGTYNLNSTEANEFIKVKWLKYNESIDANVFQSLDIAYPFSYLPSSADVVNGDIITAEVYLKIGEDSDMLLESEFALVLQDDPVSGFSFDYTDTPDFDAADKAGFQVEIASPTNDDKYFADHFTPVWFIDGQLVEGENSLTFPTQSTTEIKYGSTLTVSFNYVIGDNVGATPPVEVITFDLDISETQFNLFPVFPMPGEDITIDYSDFTDDALSRFTPTWFVNGVVDESANTLTYSGENLVFGDHVSLMLSEQDSDVTDDVLPPSFTHVAETYIGVNVLKTDLEDGIDSDGDGVLNKDDYFRYDASCSAKTAGNPDDLDGDGVSDLDELLISVPTNPNAVDTDQDGLSDNEELSAGTNPNNPDSDDDGFLDGYEVNKLATDPNNSLEPGNADIDNDRDGIINETEFILGSFVNQVDSDNDGLFDGMELSLGTELLIADSDGDGLSDGVEFYITKTDPLLIDTDTDGISDGVEVGVLYLNPLDMDTNDDGVPDEASPSDILPIGSYINMDDLNDYLYGNTPSMVPAGTCYTTWLGQQEIDPVVISHEPQLDADSEQQILFTKYEWPEIIRYNAKDSVFETPLTSASTKGNITAVEYDVSDMNIQYFGYLNGRVRKYDAINETLDDLFYVGESLRVRHIIDQGAYLLVETANEANDTYTHYLFDKESLPVSETAVDTIENLTVSYENSVWVNDTVREERILLDNDPLNASLIKETVNLVGSGTLSQSIPPTWTGLALQGPIFIESLAGERAVNFGSGQVLNLSTDTWLAAIDTFESGLQHDAVRVTVPINTAQIVRNFQTTLTGSSEWLSTQQAANDKVLSIVPVGIDTLVISHRTNGISQLNNQPPLAFELTSGDFDNDGLSDRREIELGTDINNSDTDGDGLTDGQEETITGTDPLIGNIGLDSDGDGLTDSVELNETLTEIDSSNLDDRDADFDNDGLSNYIEVSQTLTSPSLADTDGNGINDGNEDFDLDGLTNLQELNNTGTSLTNTDTDGNGTFDGSEDTDADGITDGLELNHIDPLTNEPFYDYEEADTSENGTVDGDEDFDGDALSNRVEIEMTNTNPWIADTDQDGINDGAEDRDEDGLSDRQEIYVTGTDFLNEDTDGNSVLDGDEDSDADTLTDAQELQISGTDHLKTDTDDDGLSDYDEVFIHGTNPRKDDTDGDSLTDIDEINVHLSDPSSADADEDGLTDPVELGITLSAGKEDFRSDVNKADTDGDGLNDEFEFNFVFKYDAIQLEEFEVADDNYQIDPNKPDTDDDGLSDAQEDALKLNPALGDTDNDGLGDYEEQNGTNGYRTDPKNRDTDLDGIRDGDEIAIAFTDPLDEDSNDNGILDGDEDRDLDGLSDKVELYLTLTNIEESDTDSNGVDDGLEDPDNDNLTNLEELAKQTNPQLEDTDGDGIRDDLEVSAESANNPDADDDGLPDGSEVDPSDGFIDSDPNLADTDGDGLDDYDERLLGADPNKPDFDKDYLLDGDDEDVSLLNPDADSDGLLDGIEQHYLNTSPISNDSDQDGLLDNEEVWVYAVDASVSSEAAIDAVFSSDQLLFNSRAGDANFTPSNFIHNGNDRKVLTIERVVNVRNPAENQYVALYIRAISLPDKADTDGDGLTDFTELMIIEAGTPGSFDPDVGTSNYDPNLLNSQNFHTSDPWVVDTPDADGAVNGINDGDEDFDGDFYTNILEQANENSDIAERHTDAADPDALNASIGDGIYDGIEVLLLGSKPDAVDSDEDGLFDNDELMDGYDAALDAGPVVCRVENRKVGEADVDCFADISALPFDSYPCKSTEVSLSNVAGVSYCFTLKFKSLPSEIDSDNDGVLDPDDAFALDANCSLAADGFQDLTASKNYCFSTWMAQQNRLDQIGHAQWVDDALVDQSQIAFYGEGWDKVVRFDNFEASYTSPIAVDQSEGAPDLMKVEYSEQSRRLYLAYADGNIKYIDLVSGAEVELVAGYLDVSTTQLDTIVVAGTNIVVQFKDATQYTHVILNAAGLQAVDILADAVDFDLKDGFWDQATLRMYGFQRVVGLAATNLGFISIDQVNNRFDGGITYSSTLSSEPALSGPIALSQDGVSVYLGSGQKRLAALGANDDVDPSLIKTYKLTTFTSFRELVEHGDHFVSVVDLLSGGDNVNPPTRNGVFIQDLMDLSGSGGVNNRYLFETNEQEEVLKLVPFVDTDAELIFVSKSPNKITIDRLGLKDEDGDGMSGIYESFYGLDDTNAGDRFGDLDDDLLTNIEEFNLATDPSKADTDGDGEDDADEVINNSDPLDPTDI